MRPILLSHRHRVNDVAKGCRHAALDFLNEVCAKRGKKELAEWLIGPYRTLARHATSIPEIGPATVSLHEQDIDALVGRVHAEAIATLEATTRPDGGVSFAFAAMASGFVVRCEDVDGQPGWLPAGGPRMRLADRVLSLIAADYLARTSDYERLLGFCSQCGRVSFDAAARGRGLCRRHSSSGVQFRGGLLDEESTLVGLG
jgi:hypothetical protein